MVKHTSLQSQFLAASLDERTETDANYDTERNEMVIGDDNSNKYN